MVSNNGLSNQQMQLDEKPASTAGMNCLLSTAVNRRPELPLSEEFDFLRSALSQFVMGGIYLVGGVPGGGKSLLSIQIALDLALSGLRSLFILTEERPSA